MKQLTCTLLLLATAFAASPSLTSITPPGAQRGHDHEIRFGGARLKDVAEVMFFEPGLSAENLQPAEDGKSFKATVKIAADCRIGQIPLRVRTKSGITELRQFSVGALPSVSETEPNNGFEQAQEVALNHTVAGTTANEDVDYFKFQASKGQRVTAEIEGTRLGRVRYYDPRLAILDSRKFELAASDDHPLLRQDALVSTVIPEDGVYYLSVRDSAYLGGGAPYRLHFGTFPRPTAVFPLGGKAGDKLKLRMLGMPAGPFEQEVVVTEHINRFMPVTAVQNGEFAPSPNLIRVADYRNVIESGTNNTRQTATHGGAPPFAFNGILSEPGQNDWYTFDGKKGAKYHVRVMARTLRTPVDTVINIYKKGDGRTLKGNDDTGGPDSYVQFDCPEDGVYELYVRDHLKQGGPDFAYRVEIEPVAPQLRVNLPTFTRNTQENQAIAVPRGNRMGLRLDATRQAFGGELKFLAKHLPPGVKMWTPVMASNISQVPILFEAATNAPLGGAWVDLEASHVDEARNIRGGYHQRSELLYGQNNNVWIAAHTDRLPIAVCEEAPFTLELVQPKAPLVHGGTMYLTVNATRKEGFTKPIKLRLIHRPPGLGASSEITMSEGKSTARYRINANGSIGDTTWPLAVIGWADLGGKLWVASNPIELRATTPYVTGGFEMTAVERAQPTEVLLNLNQAKPFEGEAKATLNGLPNEVTAEPLTFTKDSTQLVFQVSTTTKSPVGHHKTLFASLEIPEAGETMISSTAGGGQLRIDPPPKKPAPQVAAKPDAPKAPAPKRLSRLEKLRLEKEQEKAAK